MTLENKVLFKNKLLRLFLNIFYCVLIGLLGILIGLALYGLIFEEHATFRYFFTVLFYTSTGLELITVSGLFLVWRRKRDPEAESDGKNLKELGDGRK